MRGEIGSVGWCSDSNVELLSFPQDPSTSVIVEDTLLLLSLPSPDHAHIAAVTPPNNQLWAEKAVVSSLLPLPPSLLHHYCQVTCILTLLHSRRRVSLVFGSSGVGRRHNGIRVSELVEVFPGVVESFCQEPGVRDLCVLVEFVSDLHGLLSKQLSVGNPVSGQLERLSVHGRDQLLVGLGKGHGVGHLLLLRRVLSLPGSLYL